MHKVPILVNVRLWHISSSKQNLHVLIIVCVPVYDYSVRELEGYVFSKKAYIITIRLEQRRKIDLDIWVLAKHILDGAATLKPGSGQGPSIPAATSIPVPGDLVFADVSVQAALAHGIGLDLDALNASNGDDKSARAASVSLTSTSAAASSFAGQKIKR